MLIRGRTSRVAHVQERLQAGNISHGPGEGLKIQRDAFTPLAIEIRDRLLTSYLDATRSMRRHLAWMAMFQTQAIWDLLPLGEPPCKVIHL